MEEGGEDQGLGRRHAEQAGVLARRVEDVVRRGGGQPVHHHEAAEQQQPGGAAAGEEVPHRLGHAQVDEQSLEGDESPDGHQQVLVHAGDELASGEIVEAGDGPVAHWRGGHR